MPTYATPVALTWTPASLASGSYDGSLAINNGSDKYGDVTVGGFITAGTTPTSGKKIDIFAYGSWDAGTTYTAGMPGTDGGTPDTGEEDQLVHLGTIIIDGTSDHRYEYGPFSIAAAFGGIVPEKWGLAVYQDTAKALNATAGNHEAKYTGITY